MYFTRPLSLVITHVTSIHCRVGEAYHFSFVFGRCGFQISVWRRQLKIRQRFVPFKFCALGHELYLFTQYILRCLTVLIQCVSLATEPGISLLILTPMKVLQEYVRCVRNEKECVCSVCL